MDSLKLEQLARVSYEAVAAYITSTGLDTPRHWSLTNTLEKKAFTLRVKEIVENPDTVQIRTVEDQLIQAIVNVLK